MIWNPAYHLIKSKRYRFSYILGSTFKRRVADTFTVFFGNYDYYDREERAYKNQLGILDYIFPLPRIFMYIGVSFYKEMEKKNRVAAGILLVSTLVLYIAQLIVATMLTFAAIPIIALVHFSLSAIVSNLNKKAEALKIRPIKNNNKSLINTGERVFLEQEKKLQEFDPYHKQILLIRPIAGETNVFAWIERLRDKLCIPDNGSKPNKYFYGLDDSLFYGWDDSLSVNKKLYLGLFLCTFSRGEPMINSVSYGELMAVVELNTENEKAVKAMLQINKFWAVESLAAKNLFKEKDIFNEIDNQLKFIKKKSVRHALYLGLSKLDRNTSPLKKLATLDENILKLIFFSAGIANKKQRESAKKILRFENRNQIEELDAGSRRRFT